MCSVGTEITYRCVGTEITYRCVGTEITYRCVGTEITYRCVGTEITYRSVGTETVKSVRKARGYSISIQEEIEQDLINRSVKVNIDQGVTTAKLPFVTEPATRLVPNGKMALKVDEGQARKLESMPQVRLAVIQSKLQDLGFVDFLDNLPKEDK